jgi:flagellar basal-body rod protein FlgB
LIVEEGAGERSQEPQGKSMMPSMFDSSTLPVLEQVVNFSQARHNVLAGNIANLDTPGYRTRDISPDEFRNRLKEAVEESRRPSADSISSVHSATVGSDFDSEPAKNPFRVVKDSLNSILRHDDGNVSMEQQIAELSKNQMQHNLAVNLLASQFRLLQAAISERA